MAGLRIHWRMKRRRLTKPEELIPIKEYCQRNHLTDWQVRSRISKGHIVGFKIGGQWWVRPDPLPDE